MAKIKCPKDYNYWYILSYAGIDPSSETERYDYSEKKEELVVDVSQDDLNQALERYDHQAWLKELEQIKNPRTKEQILEDRVNELELFILSQEGLI